jgi:hypothetical protein
MSPRTRVIPLCLCLAILTASSVITGQVATGSNTRAARAVAGILQPALPRLRPLLMPYFLPRYLPADVRESMTADHAQLHVTTGPRKRSYIVSVYYREAVGSATFRIYVFKTVGRSGGLGALAARLRKVQIRPDMTTYLDNRYGGTRTTNQLGPAVYWTYHGNTYSIAVNHNDRLARLYQVVRSLTGFTSA